MRKNHQEEAIQVSNGLFTNFALSRFIMQFSSNVTPIMMLKTLFYVAHASMRVRNVAALRKSRRQITLVRTNRQT
jgi:uncharacterized protein YrrD